jgi:hypothetical protein
LTVLRGFADLSFLCWSGIKKDPRPKSQIPNPKRRKNENHVFLYHEKIYTWILIFGIWALEFGIWVLGFGIWGLEFGIWALGFNTCED